MIYEFLPTVLLFLHLLVVVLALALVLSTDYAFLFNHSKTVDIDKLGEKLLWLMIGLWSTGLLLIYLKTGFAIEDVVANSKLVMKLLCVSVLSFNGYALHRYSFNILNRRGPMSRRHALIISATGAISTSHWLMALFIGVAQPLRNYPLSSLLLFYLICCFVIIVTSIALAPRVQKTMNVKRAHTILREMGLHGNENPIA